MARKAQIEQSNLSNAEPGGSSAAGLSVAPAVASGKEPFSTHHYFMINPSLSGRGSALKRAGAAPQLVLTEA